MRIFRVSRGSLVVQVLICVLALAIGAPVSAAPPSTKVGAQVSIPTKKGSVGAKASVGGVAASKTGGKHIVDLYTQKYAKRGPNTVGVFMLPYSTSGAGDFPEQVLQQSAGEMPGISRVYAPKDGADFFKILYKLGKQKKSVDLLVIGGHAADNASMVLFGNAGQFTNADVTVLEQLQTLSPNDQKAIFETTCEKARHALAASRVMAYKADIVVLNCYAAKSDEGRKFMRNLAELLLGRNGGTLYAPTKLVKTDVMPADASGDSMLGLQTIKSASYGAYKGFMEYKVGRPLTPGETNFSSDWVQFTMPFGSFKMPDLTETCQCFLKEKPAYWEDTGGKVALTSNGWSTGHLTYFGQLGPAHVNFSWSNQDGMQGGGTMDRVKVEPNEPILDKYVGKTWVVDKERGTHSPTNYKMVLTTDFRDKDRD